MPSPFVVLCRLVLAALLVLPGAVRAEAAGQALRLQVQEFARAGARTGGGPRVEIEVGALDPRLRLAACDEVQAYLPPGTRLWGRSRVGVRCLRGPSRWNVYLPVTVRVFGAALVAARPLPAGSVIGAGDLAQAEVDLAEDVSNALRRPELALGRTLLRPLDTGRSLRQTHLQARQWFAAGETVQVVAQGSGFSVSGEAQALTPGTEGLPARLRTESGRVITGLPVGERRVEVDL